VISRKYCIDVKDDQLSGLDGRGQGSIAELASELNELEGVVSVHGGDANEFRY
jgi:hypothetical protein